tara:strand:+ start:5943 stop:6287 length:345 start_codon:yes stop_codon:yes gene_type:complete
MTPDDIKAWWENEPHLQTLDKGILIPWQDEGGDAVPYKIVSSKTRGDENPLIDGLYLLFRGYGDAVTNDGHGCPIKIENDGGRIRIVVWSDINREDYTHSIYLDEALESNRKEA